MDSRIADDAVRLCQKLIRIDTTNPPGRELLAAELLAGELSAAGLEPQVLASAPDRANVVTRVRGTGELSPLLLTAHLDVVEADSSAWAHPPFSGEIAEGFLWGRGAVDMKNMAAMSVAVLCALARAKARPKRDIIFAGVADEEAGSDLGASWLVANHADLVRAEFAFGEVGGFTMYLGNLILYPIQVAEKGYAWIRARVRGPAGHGSMPREDSAVVKLGAAVARLGSTPLPPHRTQAFADFLAAAGRGVPAPLRPILRRLGSPRLAPMLLRFLPDKSLARAMAALLSNTASPTVLRAGAKTNVIPGIAECEIDGRILPGQTTADLLRELGAVLGDEVELEVFREAPPVVTEPVPSPAWDAIVEVMGRREPGAIVAPYLIPGFTDAKAFSRLGTRWYGFTPVKLPRALRFAELYHGHDERIPIDGLRWGAETLAEVVTTLAQCESL